MSDTPQHLQAMAKANEVRTYRAARLREVAAGERFAADLLLDGDWRLERMTLLKLVESIHKVGDKQARTLLRTNYLSETITLERLSPVTRRRIANELRALQTRRDAARGLIEPERVAS